jgi:uncharacterized damage-inducible protein DinB
MTNHFRIHGDLSLWFYIFALALAFASSAAAQTAKSDSVLDLKEFAHDWEISRQFTLEVANAMPAEFYDFKPNPEEMAFGEQMVHIAISNEFRFQKITGVTGPFAIDFKKLPPGDKPTATKLLEQSFDYVIRVLPGITADQLNRTWHIPSWKGRNYPDGRAMILNMFVHTAHHRAQCEVYLRAKGIKPRDYTF